MIISASRRTDIPCYYSEWFMNRIRAGQVLTRNPVNHSQLYRVSLSPDTVDCIVFWTKDPANMLPQLDELDSLGYKYYFQFTITPYGGDLEPNLRPKEQIEDTFIQLSERLGRSRVVWRYDPIIINDNISVEYHREQFARLCGKLSPYTDTVVISFVDLYPKIKSPDIRALTDGEIAELAEFMGKTAADRGLRIETCCETADLSQYGIEHSACISRTRIEDICGCTMDVPPDKNQRDGCGCCQSIDIGAYNSCVNGCVYCYATGLFSSALARHNAHDPNSELIAGRVEDGETVIDKDTRSYKSDQLSLF
ncbi:MAG: DUF1848 domain-containing protein [Oscillospiraceae bacterium]|nr:DUF1848 domain-containing protein [Oscillospiraceae bacterium]